MPPEEERLIHAVLAGQAAALHHRIAGTEMFERLMACAELLAGLAAQLAPNGAAAAAAARLDAALDELTFHHAQQQDLARQTAELVARALGRLAASGAEKPLSLQGLAALYVCEEQRLVHDAVLARERSPRENPAGT